MATITLDMKKKRIRIYKKTLLEIDNPDYVYIWVNPEEKAIVLCACEKGSKDAVKIEFRKNCEIYSSKLFCELSALTNDELRDTETYRVDGKVLYGNKMAKFNLNAVEKTSSDFIKNRKGQYEL